MRIEWILSKGLGANLGHGEVWIGVLCNSVDGETNYCGGFKLLVEVFLGCKESVIEDVDKACERYLSIQMDFVLTAKMY